MEPAHAPPPAADKRDKLTRSQSARTVQPGGAHTLASLLPQVPRDAAYPDGGARVRWQAKSLETRARCLCASYAMPPGLALASLSRAQVRIQPNPNLPAHSTGTPHWDPTLGPHIGTPYWDPALGPHIRTPH
jgi:hypothetical protein